MLYPIFVMLILPAFLRWTAAKRALHPDAAGGTRMNHNSGFILIGKGSCL